MLIQSLSSPAIRVGLFYACKTSGIVKNAIWMLGRRVIRFNLAGYGIRDTGYGIRDERLDPSNEEYV